MNRLTGVKEVTGAAISLPCDKREATEQDIKEMFS